MRLISYFCISTIDMLEELRNFISGNKLIRDGERILLAVSGGIDSMAMAHLFLGLPFHIGIAHCNFKLRGMDSDRDEEFVKEFCVSNNIPFHSESFDTSGYAEENGISIQMAARDLRYKWFEEIRKSEKYDRIATAHNLNDHIETVLINLIRGSGLTGLSGIKPASGRIVRPLLFASREKISGYCMDNGILFREDKSNAETKYIRNKLRHLVIPVLKEINPSVEITLMETAERFRETNSIITDYIKILKEQISASSGDFVIFDQKELRKYLQNRTLLYEMFRMYGLKGTSIEDLVNIIEGRTGGFLVTETHKIYKNRKEIIVAPFGSEKNSEIIINDLGELCSYHEFSTTVVRVNDEFTIPADPSIACIDAGSIEFPVTLRNWLPGDRFIPLGMNHPKKLSDYFIDRKYSLPVKEQKRVLISGGNIIWIVGDIIDNRYRITPGTREAMIIKIN